MIKLLGLLDIIAGIIFLGSYFRVEIHKEMLLFFSVYLILKALFFIITSFDFLSLIDLPAGILLLWLFFGNLPGLVLILFAVFLLIKGIISVFSF